MTPSTLKVAAVLCLSALLAIAVWPRNSGVDPAANAEAISSLAATSRDAVKELGSRLKTELVRAMKSGGPKSAVQVCNVVAPTITQDLADKFDGTIGRTALRLRNPKNAPDDWERQVLETFNAQIQSGVDPETLERFEVIERNGAPVFRYMKAIATAKPCLACHGPNVDPKLRRTIGSLYPEDEAVGFTLGSLRGAFTVTQPVK